MKSAIKNATHLLELCKDIASDPLDETSSSSVRQTTMYLALLKGDLYLEKSQLTRALAQFSIFKIGANYVPCKELIRDIVDPSLRFCAYHTLSQSERSAPLTIIARNNFPRDNKDLVDLINPDAGVEDDVMDTQNTTEIHWHGYSAVVEDPAIVISLGRVKEEQISLTSEKGFDSLLAAWAYAEEGTKKLIEEREAKEKDESKLEDLRITYTYVRYNVLALRCQRDQRLLTELAQETSKQQKSIVTVIDGILRSLDEMADLPGIPNDKELSGNIAAKQAYYRAKRCDIISSTLSDYTEKLALLNRAQEHLSRVSGYLESPEDDYLNLANKVDELKASLKAEILKYHGLVYLNVLQEELQGSSFVSDKLPLIYRLDRYTSLDSQSLENVLGNLVDEPKLIPLPAPPFYTVVQSDDDEQEDELGDDMSVDEGHEQSKKSGGWFGLFKRG